MQEKILDFNHKKDRQFIFNDIRYCEIQRSNEEKKRFQKRFKNNQINIDFILQTQFLVKMKNRKVFFVHDKFLPPSTSTHTLPTIIELLN